MSLISYRERRPRMLFATSQVVSQWQLTGESTQVLAPGMADFPEQPGLVLSNRHFEYNSFMFLSLGWVLGHSEPKWLPTFSKCREC